MLKKLNIKKNSPGWISNLLNSLTAGLTTPKFYMMPKLFGYCQGHYEISNSRRQ